MASDFKTVKGGTGSVEVREYIEFRHPNHLIGFIDSSFPNGTSRWLVSAPRSGLQSLLL